MWSSTSFNPYRNRAVLGSGTEKAASLSESSEDTEGEFVPDNEGDGKRPFSKFETEIFSGPVY